MRFAPDPSGLHASRLSRRGFLVLGAGAAAWAAACGNGNGPRPPAGSRGEPSSGGTLLIGTTVPLSYGMDPHAEQGAGLAIFPRIFGYLVHVDPGTDEVTLDHAREFEQPDSTTYIMQVRDDVRFQDLPPVSGRRLDASDVVASVERFRDHPLSIDKTWHTTLMSGLHADDATTLRATTLRPYVYSLDNLCGISSGVIIPKELCRPGVDFNRESVGSGPFRLAGVSSGVVRIERHAGYFAQPLPYLDAMEWRIFADPVARLRAFQRGDVDMINVRQLADVEALGAAVDVVRQPSTAYVSIGLRVDRLPLQDARVREAIDIALDRSAMIRDLTLGEGEVTGPINSHVGGGYWSLPQNEIVDAFRGLDRLETRRTDARALLEAAGASGTVIRLQVPDTPELLDVASVLRDQLQTIGLALEPEPVERVNWYANYHRGSFEATLISQRPYETPETPMRLYHSAGIDALGNAFGFSDHAIDALVERSWGEVERETRRDTVLEAQRLMVRARPLVHLFTNSAYGAAWRYVRDWHPELVGSAAQYNYAQWLAPGQRADAD